MKYVKLFEEYNELTIDDFQLIKELPDDGRIIINTKLDKFKIKITYEYLISKGYELGNSNFKVNINLDMFSNIIWKKYDKNFWSVIFDNDENLMPRCKEIKFEDYFKIKDSSSNRGKYNNTKFDI